MKTFDRKNMFTIATIEGARKYINCEGYFCDSYYLDLNRWDKGILKDVNEDTTDYPFYLKPRNNCSNASFGFRFFIPVDKVKEKQKWRPFKTTEEFSEVTGKRIGSILKFKCRGKDKCYYTRMYTGFHILANGKKYIELGSEAYNLEQLYNFYEWLNEQGEWQLFGVLE